MKDGKLSLWPFLLVGFALLAIAGMLVFHIEKLKETVAALDERDLRDKTDLATEVLGASLRCGDWNRVRAFGAERRGDGIRVTVVDGTGAVEYDSDATGLAAHGGREEVREAMADGVGSAVRRSETTGEEMMYCAQKEGGYVIRLGIPCSRVMEPVVRAWVGLVLSGTLGVLGFLLIFLFSERAIRRVRELSLERDNQERVLAEMRKVEELRRDFISDMAHEIKTPLSGILAVADVLQCPDSLPEGERAALLESIAKESSRLHELAQNILQLARLESVPDEMRNGFIVVDVEDLVRGVCARLKSQAKSTGVKLLFGEIQPTTACCDPKLLEEALSNLICNAIIHSQSPDVIVSVERAQGGVRVAVEDHGIGIDPVHHARLFDRFYRVDRARSRDRGGTGLGLAIVRQVARLHCGDVTVESVLGKGTRFTLTIR